MITERQSAILTEIIRQYSQSAEPVGSHSLMKAFVVSSATIRSEMANLEQKGYIYQPHISSGRVPTDKGYRYYVNNMAEYDAKPRYELTVEKRVASMHDQVDRAIKVATETLSEMSGNTAFATLSDTVYFHGLHQLFSQPEFLDSIKAAAAARYLDSLSSWLLESSPDDGLAIFIGAENPFARTSGMAMVVARFGSPYSENSAIGIVGPTRQDYGKVTTLVELTSKKLQEVLN
ncbi:MAG: transcriptional regulator [bacterium]